MLDTALVDYLESVGIVYQSAESPLLWSHLEGHFTDSRSVGSKFTPLSEARIADLISEGEKALLDDLVKLHRKTGRIDRTICVLTLPYVVGTQAIKLRSDVNAAHLLKLVYSPGTMRERLIEVLPTPADEIPCTYEVTVEGGLYADGRTAGYYDLYPGNVKRGGKSSDSKHIYLATPDEIRNLVNDMQDNLADITIANKPDCEAMIQKAKKAVKHISRE